MNNKDDDFKKNEDFFKQFDHMASNSKNSYRNNNLIQEIQKENEELNKTIQELKEKELDFKFKSRIIHLLIFCFGFIVIFSALYIMCLLKVLQYYKEAIYLIGTFTLSVTLALIFICGTVFKSIFITNESKENKDISINKILETNPILKELSDKLSTLIELMNKKK